MVAPVFSARQNQSPIQHIHQSVNQFDKSNKKGYTPNIKKLANNTKKDFASIAKNLLLNIVPSVQVQGKVDKHNDIRLSFYTKEKPFGRESGLSLKTDDLNAFCSSFSEALQHASMKDDGEAVASNAYDSAVSFNFDALELESTEGGEQLKSLTIHPVSTTYIDMNNLKETRYHSDQIIFPVF